MTRMSAEDARTAALRRIVDDAALFPPARLPMEAALRGHARHVTGPAAWLVGRFLCPASRLDELTALLGDGDALELGVIGDGRSSAQDVAAARAAAANPLIRVTALEVRLTGAPETGAAVDEVLGAVASAGLDEAVDVACEIGVAGHPADRIDAAVTALAKRATTPHDGVARLLVKARCGGAEAAAYPSVRELAAVVAACAQRGLGLKATAGLHHPHRHTDTATGINEHGFLNLLAAVALADEGRTADELAEVLDERSPDALRLAPDGLHVAGQMVDAARLAALRERAYAGQGSCSIDEPVADLTALGVLPVTA